MDELDGLSGYNKDDIYYGEFSLDELKTGFQIKDLESKSLDLQEYEFKLRDTNRMLNEARLMLKGKTSTIKGFVSDTSTIQKKASGKSAFSGGGENQGRGGEGNY